jgi:multiple sugar transport system permease protein
MASSSVPLNRPSAAPVASRVLFYGLASMLTLFFLGPFVWTLISSLKQPSEISAYPPVFIPAVLRFDNYASA